MAREKKGKIASRTTVALFFTVNSSWVSEKGKKSTRLLVTLRQNEVVLVEAYQRCCWANVVSNGIHIQEAQQS